MKKILFFLSFLWLFTSSTFAQIKPCQLPQTNTGSVNDWLIKTDSACGTTSVKKMKVSDFLAHYGVGSSSIDTAKIQNDTLFIRISGVFVPVGIVPTVPGLSSVLGVSNNAASNNM